jgi:hypothetical protein
MPCKREGIMKWSVVVNMGKFDITLYRSESKPAAKIYRTKLKKLTNLVKIKRTKKVRILKENFIDEEVILSLSV